MNIKEQKINAEKFANKENYAYIHTEIENGKPETVLCGDFIAMLFGIEAEINRISELTGMDYMNTLSILAMNYKIGRQNVMDLTKGMPKKEVKGSFDLMREEIEKEVKRADNKADKSIADLKKQLRNAKLDYGTLKAKLEKQEKDSFAKEQKLQKEILRLEHDNEDLRHKLMFGKEN